MGKLQLHGSEGDSGQGGSGRGGQLGEANGPAKEVRYRAMLVDDEPMIIRSLKVAIPWAELGIEVVAEAGNGEEALRLAERHKPHMLISDIRMPSLDGIGLMQQALAREPELVFIFISGYGEFEYAREALRQGAFDYLLKPIDHEELEGMLRRGVAKLDGLHAAKLESERLHHSVQSLSLLARERMLAEQIEGSGRPLQQLRWMENSELEQPYWLALVRLDRYGMINKQWAAEEKRLWFFAIRNILEEWSEANGALAAFPFHSGEWVVLFPAVAMSAQRKLGEELVATIKACSKLACSVGISHTASGLTQLSRTYESASRALYDRFSFGQEGVFCDEGGRGEGNMAVPAPFPYPKQIEESMLEAVRTLDLPGLRQAFGQLGRQLSSGNVAKELAERIIVELAVILHRQFEHLSLAPGDALEGLLRKLQEAGTLEDLLGALEEAFAGWLQEQRERGPREESDKAIEKAQQYISHHYHKDLGMDEVAELVHLSPSYFCTLFKQVSGCTFLEYLTQCRIDKAKSILRSTDVKVYQIAPLVGYQDAKYFTQVFKRLVGRTPSEYRELG